ncbi:hypothetical protein SeLEV6574_g04981 [Synchytrium endobioticum]|uniref:Uncharacterized protein n=1 Tax=Synchytrium endobioticum TaxID=286115 RepID=A0A507CWK0_9FUNG|nr:hypothetical protein SeLEV6574_g04981 [Synchytrium endobioticum]
MDEGKVLAPLDRSKELGKRDERLARISKARAALVANRGNRGNEYLFKAHWTTNPFRLLQSVGEVPCYTPSTIDRTIPMKWPVPPVLKVSPKLESAPSGRSSRSKNADDDNSLGPKTSKKNFSEATRVIASLSKRCGGYRTIHVGHLRGHIGINQQETIARRINDAVGILNRARAIAERATEMLIDGICSSNQDTHLLLQLTLGGKGSANYWQNLIVYGTIGDRVGSEHRPILEKVQALWGANFLRNLSWPDTDIKIPMLTVLIQKVTADIDTVFSNQIVGMLPLLKERVVEVVGEQGKQAVEGIDAWVDESLEDD